MMGVALLLLDERESRSYSLAGLAAALFAGGAALGGVAYARAIARLGYGGPLTIGGLIGAGALALVPVATRSAAPPVYLALVSAAGLAFPPLAACIRTEWNRSYSDPVRLLRAATFESVMGEVAFLVGPVLVTVAVSAGSEAAPFPLAGGMVGVAAVGFACSAGRAGVRDSPADVSARHAMWRSGFVSTLLAGALWCVSFGVMTVGIVAASEATGRRALSGLLVAVVSLGAILGGLVFGARAWRARPARLLVAVLAGYATCLAPLAVAHRSLLPFALFLVLVGTTSAVVLACLNLRVVAGVPREREVEAYGWLNAFTVGGLAIGPAIGGQLAERLGPGEVFVAASALAALGAAVSLRGRSA